MKTLIIMLLSSILAVAPQDVKTKNPENFLITADKVENGIRTIEAVPSDAVCSKKIVVVIDTDGDLVQSIDYTGGCPGNLKAIKALTKGMTVDQVIEKLNGIECANRKTSCTDQLTRILKVAYGK